MELVMFSVAPIFAFLLFLLLADKQNFFSSMNFNFHQHNDGSFTSNCKHSKSTPHMFYVGTIIA